MKKNILLIILFMLLLPLNINASEKCQVISGNGKEIGSEIACGSEHFYVIEYNNETIKMIAKHNLLVGDKISYFAAEADNLTYANNNAYSNGNTYCNDLATSKGINPYHVYPFIEYNDENGTGTITGCRVYEKLNPEHIRQDEKAVGSYLVNGKASYPLYGIVYMNSIWGYDYMHDGVTYQNEYDDNGNLVIETSSFKNYFNGYKEELENQNIDVLDISFMTFSGALKLLKNISNQDIMVKLTKSDELGYNFYYGKMDIRNYVANKYKWIYDTNYWLGSGFVASGEDLNEGLDIYNDYFISNEGMLCALGRGECSNYPYPIGQGLRPVITISSNDVLYLIRTKTDGNGVIEVINEAQGGSEIKFKIKSNPGYRLDSLTIVTDSNEKVNFTKGEIVNNSDGTISVDKNEFTMPFENVTIEAKWVTDIINPKTGTLNYLVLSILSIAISISLFMFINRKTINLR